MSAINEKVVDRTGFESHFGRISMAVLVVYLTMLNLSLWIAPGSDTTYLLLGVQQMGMEIG